MRSSSFLVAMPSSTRKRREGGQRIARRFLLALVLRLIKAFVVAEGMRIGPDAVRMHEGGTMAFAAPRRRRAHGAIRGDEIGAVHLDGQQIRKTGQQFRDGSARRLALHGNRDRPAVVFDQEEHRDAVKTGLINGFPEFALAGGAFAGTDQHQPVFARMRDAQAFRAADRLDELGARGRRGRDNVFLGIAPVRRHLAAAGGRIFGGARRLQQHVGGVIPRVRARARSR